MRHHRLLSILVVGLVVLVGMAATSLHSPAASAQTAQIAGTSACFDTGTGISNCTITLQTTLTAGQAITATLPTGEAFISCTTLSAAGTCTLTAPGVSTFTCSAICTAGNQFTESIQGPAAIALAQVISMGTLGTSASVGTASCADTGTGQANCSITLTSTINAGGTLLITLPAGETFVSCGAPTILGTCTVNGTALTLLCPNGCGAGSQFTEVVQGPAATALGQSIIATGVGINGVTQNVGTVQCVSLSTNEASCTVALATTLNPGTSVTLTLPAGTTFIACTSSNVGACVTTTGASVATFTCYSGCGAGNTFTELVFGTPAQANAQTILATNLGVNSLYGNPYASYTNPYFNSYNPYTYGLTGYLNGYGGCSFAVSGTCIGNTNVTSPYSGYGYGGYGYGGTGYGGAGYGGSGYGGSAYGGYSGYPYYPYYP